MARRQPSLDSIARDPDLAQELVPEEARDLALAGIDALRALVDSQLGSVLPAKASGREGEHVLDAEAVATRLGRSKSWVEHHIRGLPPRRSLSGSPVWLQSEIERWILDMPVYGKSY